MRWGFVLAMLAASGLVLSACGGSTIDTEAIEERVAQLVEENSNATAEEVDCPDDVDAEEGNDFECTVTDSDGDVQTAEVVQTDDEGNVEITITRIEGDNARQQIEQLVVQRLVEEYGNEPAEIECPRAYTLNEPSECRITDPEGTTGTGLVTLAGEGQVELELQGFDDE